MRIQNNNINKMMNVYNSQANVSKTTKAGLVKKTDELNISSAARDFQVAMKEVNSQPEVREEKVTSLMKQIQAGTYKIDGTKIAEKMMQDANIYRKY